METIPLIPFSNLVTCFGSTVTFTPEFGCRDHKNDENLSSCINENSINDLISATRPQIEGRTAERTDEHCLHIRNCFFSSEVKPKNVNPRSEHSYSKGACNKCLMKRVSNNLFSVTCLVTKSQARLVVVPACLV